MTFEVDGKTYTLKEKPPKDRTVDQLWNHFVVERRLANELKNSRPEDREAIYRTMYAELFAKVPDHPRLQQRESAERTAMDMASKAAMLSPFLQKDTVLADFGCGDASFAMDVADRVGRVYGIDISDQRKPQRVSPANFEMVVYDGHSLPTALDGQVDVIYSDQLLEHIHPDEVENHFRIINKSLKRGGVYVIRTPYALSGPEDVSRYFSDRAEGFHMHEWLLGELIAAAGQYGFTGTKTYWNTRQTIFPVPTSLWRVFENLLKLLPRSLSKKGSKFVFPNLVCALRKG